MICFGGFVWDFLVAAVVAVQVLSALEFVAVMRMNELEEAFRHFDTDDSGFLVHNPHTPPIPPADLLRAKGMDVIIEFSGLFVWDGSHSSHLTRAPCMVGIFNVWIVLYRGEQDLEEFREALELMEVADLTLPDGRPSAAFRQLVRASGSLHISTCQIFCAQNACLQY
eukprot:COSAG05_NODE_1062_length_5993_cov_8.045640_1_plen_168_part_00